MVGERWALDKAALAVLLNALHPDPATAASEYERLRRRLVRYFSLHGIARGAEAADEAFDRLAKRLSQGESIQRIEPYLAGIARMLVLEERQRMHRQQDALRELQSADAPRSEHEPMLEALERCLQELPHDARELLRRYYAGEGGERMRDRESMARELGLTANSLRNRVLRLREKLERAVRARLAAERERDVHPFGLSSTQEGD